MKDRRASISLVTTLEIFFSRMVSFSFLKNSSQSFIESAVSSTMFLPPISTCSASSRRRAPWQSSHGSVPKRYLVPRPLHSGHAPYGELKEKSLGSISGNEKPSLGQAHLADIRCSSFGPPEPLAEGASLVFKRSKPSDSCKAFSIASFNLSSAEASFRSMESTRTEI